MIERTRDTRHERDELTERPCPWTGRPIMRDGRGFRYVDTLTPCPWRVAYAAGFKPQTTE